MVLLIRRQVSLLTVLALVFFLGTSFCDKVTLSTAIIFSTASLSIELSEYIRESV